MIDNKIYPGGGKVECGKKTPIQDLLRKVPKDYRLLINHDEHSSSYHPVGVMCHDAADRIDQLESDMGEGGRRLVMENLEYERVAQMALDCLLTIKGIALVDNGHWAKTIDVESDEVIAALKGVLR